MVHQDQIGLKAVSYEPARDSRFKVGALGRYKRGSGGTSVTVEPDHGKATFRKGLQQVAIPAVHVEDTGARTQLKTIGQLIGPRPCVRLCRRGKGVPMTMNRVW